MLLRCYILLLSITLHIAFFFFQNEDCVDMLCILYNLILYPLPVKLKLFKCGYSDPDGTVA